MSSNYNNNYYILVNAGISRNKLTKWNELQNDLKEDGIVITEFQPSFNLKPIIQLYESKKTGNNRLWSKNLNLQMHSYIYDKGGATVHKQFKQRIKHIGILTPVYDVKVSEIEDLGSVLNILGYWLKQHSILDFADSLKVKVKQKEPNKLPIPILFTFSLLEDYYQMVLSKPRIITEIKNIGGWFWNIIDTSDFEYKLNVEQFLILCVIHIESMVVGYVGVPDTKSLEVNASEEVLEMWTQTKEKINAHFEQQIKKDDGRFMFSELNNFKHEIDSLKKLDKQQITAFHILKNARTNYFKIFESHRDIIEKANTSKSFMELVGNIFSKKNVVEKIQSLNQDNTVNRISVFKRNEIDNELYQKFKNNIERSDVDKLNSAAINLLKQDQKNELSKSVSRAVTLTYRTVLNSICRPIYTWNDLDIKDNIPKLLVPNNEYLKGVFEYLSFKKKQEAKEGKLLDENIKKLQEVFSLTGIQQLIFKVPNFVSFTNQKKWDLAVESQKATVKYRRSFRLRKMKELGITDDLVVNEHQKEVYLNEMLQVEDEIRRFVPFVTSAFLSALPSRKTVEFDTYRHNYDGIEFDPETTMDPEKWMRGHVMKTLKHKTVKGEVTQVNSFCLDLSGSMHHDRMRNLYKILYLLVLGLESRKSFDAFHFFSNTFLPGVDFSGKYTKKDLLFRVLRKISEVVGTRVLYRGLEGTNISAGITGCKKSLIKFVKRLKEQHPTMNISCSIFVITDGEPSLGIQDLGKLNKFIQDIRDNSKIAVKGIYIKSAESLRPDFISRIFGDGNSVQTASFEEGVHELTAIMTKTYREQREEFKWHKKRKKLNLENSSSSIDNLGIK